MKPLPQTDAAAALAWLGERGDSVSLGYDAGGWDAKVWIVNAMYETEMLPGGLSHDDARRIEDAAGATEPVMVGNVDLYELLSHATLIGGSLGASGWPGPGWNRLRWSELASRLGVDPYATDVPPCFRSFPYVSWPVNIAPPAEGSLDREQFVRLIDHLAEVSTDGYATSCFSFYSPLASGELDAHTLYRCELRELPELYDDDDERTGSPSNVWPHDKSWFIYTDWDLWATKVSGSDDLIERLLRDGDLEAVLLDF